MYEPNVQELLARLEPGDLVLDVGGWACPFNRAQWILDGQPYDTRGFYKTFGGPPYQGGSREWFSRDTWVQRDICARSPWPFSDRQFDFVVCSHTLEDLRDPLWVCSELIRVAKAGYIEVPSRAYESCIGVERPRQAGLSHHRWLIDIEEMQLRFLQKYHLIHTERRFHLPKSFHDRLTPGASVQWLWWTGTFEFQEVEYQGVPAQEAELERFVAAACPSPMWQHHLARTSRWLARLPRRVTGRIRRELARTDA
jgi:hypothetical protein